MTLCGVVLCVQHGNEHAGASTSVEEGHRCARWEHGLEEGFRRGICNNGFEASAFPNFVSRTFSYRWAALDFKMQTSRYLFPLLEVQVVVACGAKAVDRLL
jgi:hypothetical protein